MSVLNSVMNNLDDGAKFALSVTGSLALATAVSLGTAYGINEAVFKTTGHDLIKEASRPDVNKSTHPKIDLSK